MSLFNKIDSGMKSIDVLSSITHQIHILFSNRTDVYWAYDAADKNLFSLHGIFQLDKFSPEFLLKLSKGLAILDPRIKRAVCSWSFANPEFPDLNIDCILKVSPTKIDHFSIPMSIRDL